MNLTALHYSQRTCVMSLLLLFTLSACGNVQNDQSNSFDDLLLTLEQELGGTIGVFAMDTTTGSELAYRADERFAMASTFKPLLVAAVLAEVDAGTLNLEERYGIEDVDMQSYSPVVGKLAANETISLSELCAAAITISDNTATNMLLDLIGGPDELTQFLRRSGDDMTRLDRNEGELNSNIKGDERDTSTPRAMTHSVYRLLNSDTLSSASKRRITEWLIASQTGFSRLRAGLPPGWTVGDKTGMGANGAANNIAIAWPPGRKPVVMTVFMSWSEADVDTLNAAHARIAARIAESFE
ncbi:MAG: class A beta-lactamase [Woeseia sp.]